MARMYHRLSPIVCPSCKKTFRPRIYTTVYCSRKCHVEGSRRTPISVESKTCSKCGIEKPATAFHRNASSADGLQSWCRSCLSLRDRTIRIEYKCEECGKPLVRTTPKRGKRVFNRDLCPRCIRSAVMAQHGGHTANWTGSDNFAGRLIANWRFSARRRGHRWSLTKEHLDHQFLLQGGVCALSGITMVLDKSSPYRPSIDRIDSDRGYEIGNFQFVCSIVNVMKNKIPEDLFLDLCASIVRFRKQPQFPVGVEEDSGKLIS